jgi:hypothetical protein
MLSSSTAGRVPRRTAPHVNRRIETDLRESIRFYADHPHRIGERLRDLDREWDIERMIEANASALALVGLGLGAAVDRRFLALPAIIAGFLMQHAVQGWCPPVPVLRRLGFRTAEEIARERYALKALRGDFERVGRAWDDPHAAEDAFEAAQA